MAADIMLESDSDYPSWRPWWMLVRLPAVAWSVQILLLAALGALGTTAGWRIAQRSLLTESEVAENLQVASDAAYFGAWPSSRTTTMCDQWSEQMPLLQSVGKPPADPVTTVPYRLLRPLAQFLEPSLSGRARAYYILGGLWTLFIWSLFGAAITRMTAVWLGRDERIGMSAALRHARNKVVSHLAACLLPLSAVAGVAVLLAVWGLLARWTFVAMLVGLFWIVPLLVSSLIAVVMVGLLFGWPLIWGAIDTECSDSFDGMSRAYAYTYQRPIQYLALVLVAALVGILGWLLVWLVSELVIQLAAAGVSAGAGASRSAELLADSETNSTMLRWGHHFIDVWNGVIRTLASAYAYAYFWCAATGIYLLLRMDVDRTELDEIPEPEGSTPYRLPPLEHDRQGIVSVAADDDTMQP